MVPNNSFDVYSCPERCIYSVWPRFNHVVEVLKVVQPKLRYQQWELKSQQALDINSLTSTKIANPAHTMKWSEIKNSGEEEMGGYNL